MYTFLQNYNLLELGSRNSPIFSPLTDFLDFLGLENQVRTQSKEKLNHVHASNWTAEIPLAGSCYK